MDDGPATSLKVRNNRAITGHANGTVNVWDLDQAQRLYRFKRNDASIWAAGFTGSEDRIATASHDWTVALWETASESPGEAARRSRECGAGARRRPLRHWLASGSADKAVKLWDLETREMKRTYRHNSDFISAFAFSGDASMIAAGSLDGSIRLLADHRVSGHCARFNAHKSRVTAIAFSANGELLASAAEGRQRAPERPEAAPPLLDAQQPRTRRQGPGLRRTMVASSSPAARMAGDAMGPAGAGAGADSG